MIDVLHLFYSLPSSNYHVLSKYLQNERIHSYLHRKSFEETFKLQEKNILSIFDNFNSRKVKEAYVSYNLQVDFFLLNIFFENQHPLNFVKLSHILKEFISLEMPLKRVNEGGIFF